ncbi:MAG: ABC transporter substrate-binding protein [Pseudomonadota bacterium]
MIKSFVALAMAGLLALGPAQADSTEEAEAFVVALVEELKTLAERDGEGSPAMRAALEENHDTRRIGQELVAKRSAETAGPEHMERYNALFPAYIAAAYAKDIGRLAAREIKVTRSLERRPGDLVIESELYDDRGAKRASIAWRVSVSRDGEHRLFDVLVAGTSQLITRRQIFSDIIKREGFDGLLTQMQETIDAGVVIEDD